MEDFDSVYKISPENTEAVFTLENFKDESGSEVKTVLKTFTKHRAENFLEVNMHKIASEQSEGVVRFYESSTSHGLLRIRMAFCERNSLLSAMTARNGQRWTAQELLEMYRSMLQTLADVHRQRVVHRCLDLSNWLVTAAGEPKLCDFGQAKMIKSQETTSAHTVRVNPYYASPYLRRLEEGDKYDPFKEDVWDLGKVFYEMAVLRVYKHLNTQRDTDIVAKVARDVETFACSEITTLITGMLADQEHRISLERGLEIVSAALQPLLRPSPEAEEQKDVCSDRPRRSSPEPVWVQGADELRLGESHSATSEDDLCCGCRNEEVLSGLLACRHLMCLDCTKRCISQRVSIVCAKCEERVSVNDFTNNAGLSIEVKEAMLFAIQKACEDRRRRLPK